MNSTAHANLLRVLSTPRRIEILRALQQAGSPMTSGNLAAMIGISEAAMSYNIGKLSDVGLVIRMVSGKHVLYGVNKTTMRELIKFWRLPPGKGK
jgi:DNA-binding transcriptional ArsR family regulator